MPRARSGCLRLGARTLCAVLALTAFAGCILPVAPEFEDPEPNVAPYIVSATPAQGSVQTLTAGSSVEFSALLGDANLGDTLYYRWVFDYPPYDPAQSRVEATVALPPALDGNPVRGTATITPNCIEHSLAPGLTTHRLLLLVADRPFLSFDEGNPYENVPKDAFITRAFWILNLECR